MEDNKIEVIGVDHGWANIKTVSQVFTSGVKEISTEPALYDNILDMKVICLRIGKLPSGLRRIPTILLLLRLQYFHSAMQLWQIIFVKKLINIQKMI